MDDPATTAELSIAEVCRRSGLSSRTLRFWEARGLIGARRTAAGQRCYGAAEMARLHQVATLKRAGFTLAQIAGLLGAPGLDLARLIDAQLEALNVERDRIDEAQAALRAARARLAAGRAVDIDTFCTLIKQGETAMTDQAAWQKVYDRYYSPEEQAEWVALKERAFAHLDMDAYARDWKLLTDRIEAALPLDPASAAAQAFVAEWRALTAPFLREAAPKLAAGTVNLYDRIDEWSDTVEPPFSKRVWDFITAASAAASTETPPA